jgi:prolyl oligopeptidase PreP (S9A serine peptidase family)
MMHGCSAQNIFASVVCSAAPTDLLRSATSDGGRTWIDEYGDPGQVEDAVWLTESSPYVKMLCGIGRRAQARP